MRIVLDTNVLLVSIPRKSKYRPIFNGLLGKKFTLLISNEILSEYEEIIRQKTSEAVSRNIVQVLLNLSNVEKTEIYYKWKLIEADPDDDKFVDCSISGNADVLVTNDRHFKTLEAIDFPRVPLMTAQEFLAILAE